MGLRRREFMAALGGAAAWPLAARAQQGGRLRVLPEPQARLAAVTRGLRDLSWTDEEIAKVLYLPAWTEGRPAVGINLSAAKAIGRTVPPPSLLVLADEIAE